MRIAAGSIGSRMLDGGFFRHSHEHWNLASPWLPDELQRKREDLFAAGMEIHRAFVDVAAQRVSHNIGALMNAMQAGALHDPSQRALLGDLWSTLFMVCPVASTTFASVDRLRARLRDERRLMERIGVGTHEIDDWLENRVGTIHTFQGKEAEAVIAVLGAPGANQQGARRWAAGTPNILNVMVSRAQRRLYVVGSHAAWSSVGHGRALASSLPVLPSAHGAHTADRSNDADATA